MLHGHTPCPERLASCRDADQAQGAERPTSTRWCANGRAPSRDPLKVFPHKPAGPRRLPYIGGLVADLPSKANRRGPSDARVYLCGRDSP